MNIANIIPFDSGNARGLSVAVFVSGCEHHCPECHNPETWDFDYGIPIGYKIEEIIKALDNPHIKNLVLTGGDPMHPKNIDDIMCLLTNLQPILKKYNQQVIIYTGYLIEELTMRTGIDKEITKCILEYSTYVIDGKYDRDKKPQGLDYRGSLNQHCWKLSDDKTYFKNISKMYFKETWPEDTAFINTRCLL